MDRIVFPTYAVECYTIEGWLAPSNANEKRRIGQRRVGVQAMKEAGLNTVCNTPIDGKLLN